MEVQSLQEAIQVGIQCHQKLAVRSCPVGSAKPIPLIKAPSSQSIAISVIPAKAPVTMVTAHLNGQKTATASAASANSAEPPQTAPINLQTTSKLVGGTLNMAARRVSEMPHAQTLGTITAVPIKVPQVSSLHRLAGHGPAVLPQVRPKTLIPDSLPISLCRDQPLKQPTSFQKATVVSIKNPSPALPTANNTVSHLLASNGQSQSSREPTITSPLSSGGVAYAIISTSPSNANPINTSTVSVVNDGIKVQPLLISADSKVIIIQPQVQSQPESKKEFKKPCEEPPQGPPATKKKKEENPEKIAFMVALGLVTTEHLEEIQSKRHERKRRSTANPAYSGLLEPERKRLASNYLSNPFLTGKAISDSCWKDQIIHDEHCSACKRGNNLQPCGNCPRAYHVNCLDSPVKIAPKGVWMCPKCQQKVLKKETVPWSGAVAIVQSYVTHKSVKEEEKRKLLKKGNELKNEQRQLEDQERLLREAMKKCLELKNSLLARQRGTQSSLERLKSLIRLIQNEQMLQVTMTTTTTSSSSSLLTVPWIKPSASTPALHKGLQQPQTNN
ncbi:PREDICTED: PHD finger protein 21B isoform X1 [Nanorana parkeri]|uniref:PHD finger protein 21B isoform X1 n=1 Tax=Nanorana parkeri TaxID=125878 RepID=UPI00085410F3|nr:PREDICTED: PHD finger protein 21B isoform X1 [Nanorana parkeri]